MKKYTNFILHLTLIALIGFLATTATFYLVSLRPEQGEISLGDLPPKPLPFTQRYKKWLGTIIHSGLKDWGHSYSVPSVKDELKKRLPVTLSIGLITWLLSWGLGLFVAILLSTRIRSLIRPFLGWVYPAFQALPSLPVIILAYILLQSSSGLSATTGWLSSVAVLCFLLSPASGALWLQAIERVRKEEYIRVARIRGVSPRRLWSHHILPAVLTTSGLLNQMVFSFASLIVGSFFVEGIFQVDGVAASFIQAAEAGRSELAATASLVFFVPLMLGILLAELITFWFDPTQKNQTD